MTVKRPPTRRPRVAGHNRRTEKAVETPPPPPPPPSSEEPSVVDDPADSSHIEENVVVTPRSRLPLLLVVVAAVLVGLGTFFLVKANSVDRGGDTRALTEVNGQVRADLQKVFSFSYDK